MKTLFGSTKLLALCFLFLLGKPLFAQIDDQVDALRNALSGQRLLVTFRDGGALYGTYYFLDVQFCHTGRYFTAAQSRKTTVLDNEQVNDWSEIGNWDIISVQNQLVLRYVSLNGKTNFAPARLLSDGHVWLGDGVSVQRKGATACR